MAPKHLSIVQGEGAAPDGEEAALDHGRAPDTVANRVKRLQEEARMLAREEVESFLSQIILAASMADEIAQGGEAYPVGVRSMAEQLAEELPLRVQSIQAILERVKRS